MERHRTQFSVQKMTKVLKVSRSGFYAWLKRPESSREKETRLLDALIQARYKRSNGRSGSCLTTTLPTLASRTRECLMPNASSKVPK
jgi:hypothetical protein